MEDTYRGRLSIPASVQSGIHIGIGTRTELHIERRRVRREEDDRLASILVAPIVCILSTGILDKPVADAEALVGEVVGLPDSEAVGVAAEVFLRILRVAH